MGWFSPSHKSISHHIETANEAIPQFEDGITNAKNCLLEGSHVTAKIYPLTIAPNQAARNTAAKLLQELQAANAIAVQTRNHFTRAKDLTVTNKAELLYLEGELGKARVDRKNKMSGSAIIGRANEIAWGINQRVMDQDGPEINGLNTLKALEAARDIYSSIDNQLS